MFDTVLGLPLHALVLHGTVVLLPLVSALTVWWAWRPFGGRLVAAGLVLADASAAGMAWVTKLSGEELQQRLGGKVALEHGEIGSLVPVFALALFVGALALALVRRRGEGLQRGALPATGVVVPGVLVPGLAALTSVAALALFVWTVRAGHSGATSVWGEVVKGTSR